MKMKRKHCTVRVQRAVMVIIAVCSSNYCAVVIKEAELVANSTICASDQIELGGSFAWKLFES